MIKQIGIMFAMFLMICPCMHAETNGSANPAAGETEKLVVSDEQAAKMRLSALEREAASLSRRLSRVEGNLERFERDLRELKSR